ncbi:hypothetical protein M0R19_06055 [Candidatus Pacearchaeota archaeon]|jgi:hypothetical protein|nr:hypothetical protein [Candidatus Pacearchaeota archaeon]
MATKAIHKLGDISSNKPDIFHIRGVRESYYLGEWLTGFGFMEVKFPKETTRDLTKEEIEYYNTRSIHFSNGASYKLNILENGDRG